VSGVGNRTAIGFAVAWAMGCGIIAPAAAETLSDELGELLRSHPQIQSKTNTVRSSESGIGVARSAYLPSVKMSTDGGPDYVNSTDRKNTQGKSWDRAGESASVTVTQHIFDGYATDSSVGAAKITRDVSEADLRTTRQNVLLEAATAYSTVLRATRLIELARDSVGKVQDQLNLEDERVEKGAGITSDVLAAKQRLQTAKEQRVRFEGDLQTAVAKYTQVFGHVPNIAALAEPPFPGEQISASLADALKLAEKENPSVETAAKNINLSEEKRAGANAGYYPTLDLVGKASYDDGKNAAAGQRKEWSVLLQANWEIFSGFKTDSQVAVASHDLAASKDNHLYALRKVQEAARTAWFKLNTARERMELLKNASILAEEVWKSTRLRHEAGKATIREVLDDEIRINDSRISYAQAYYDMISAGYEMLAAMGRMEVDFIAGDAPGTPGFAPTVETTPPGIHAGVPDRSPGGVTDDYHTPASAYDPPVGSVRTR
jgi:outer membrane protein, adhesin transport system